MASSRDWVCIRVTSYEDSLEFDFLEALYLDGLNGLESYFWVSSGQLPNTTFGLLGPDGRTRLSCIARNPHFILDTLRVQGAYDGGSGTPTERFARVLRTLAVRQSPKAPLAALPQALDYRRALNAAACDDQPLVCIHASSEDARQRLEARVAALAWSDAFVGRLQYIVAEPGEGPPGETGVVVLEPGFFGLEANVLARAPEDASTDALRALFERGLASYDRARLTREQHGALGRRRGVSWDCPFPPRAQR